MTIWLKHLPVINIPALTHGPRSRAGARGFTLIEILVALTIFAITSSALIGSTTKHIAQSIALREKTIAHWVAENELNRLRVPEETIGTGTKQRTTDRFPRLGTDYKQITMADQTWEVEIDVTSTENKDIRRITVEVSKTDRGDSVPVYSLDGFIGRY